MKESNHWIFSNLYWDFPFCNQSKLFVWYNILCKVEKVERFWLVGKDSSLPFFASQVAQW